MLYVTESITISDIVKYSIKSDLQMYFAWLSTLL